MFLFAPYHSNQESFYTTGLPNPSSKVAEPPHLEILERTTFNWCRLCRSSKPKSATGLRTENKPLPALSGTFPSQKIVLLATRLWTEFTSSGWGPKSFFPEDAAKPFMSTRPVFHLRFGTRLCPHMWWVLGFVSQPNPSVTMQQEANFCNFLLFEAEKSFTLQKCLQVKHSWKLPRRKSYSYILYHIMWSIWQV